jgi:hypothetical protein
MLDSPTFSATDGNGGNFCTYNFLNAGTSTTLSEGNLQVTGAGGASAQMPSGSMAFTSGKWYFERYISAYSGGYPYMGLAAIGNVVQGPTDGGDIWATRFNPASGTVIVNSGANITGFGTITPVSTGLATAGAGDIIAFHLDLDNRKCWITKNGAFVNSGDPSAGTNPQWSWTETPSNPITFFDQIYTSSSTILNAGQDGTFAGAITAGGNADENGYGNFKYAPDTGFLAMCAANIPTADAVDPAQTDDNYPQKLFAPTLYTGNGTSISVSTGFQTDLAWVKWRDGTYDHTIGDSSRGTGKYIQSDTNAAETSNVQSFTAFGSDGFTYGSELSGNQNTYSMISWNWRANGGTTAANSVGDIATVTQVDPSGCFSIVTYTGDGVAGQTLGHGLSVAPDMILVKNRDQADSWAVYHSATGNAAHFILDTDAAYTTSSAYWGSTTPTSTVWTTGNDGKLNTNTEKYVAYCFANCEGYIKAGSYIGNANADGTFVYTGFKPAFFLCKPILAGNWRIQDTKRSPYNVADETLYPNNSNAEESYSSDSIDILSNGVKMRASDSNYNQATTFIYLAMAHNPFQYATAR